MVLVVVAVLLLVLLFLEIHPFIHLLDQDKISVWYIHSFCFKQMGEFLSLRYLTHLSLFWIASQLKLQTYTEELVNK